MVTIYDIAKKTGFSVTTVSKVLNNYRDVGDKTRRSILEAVEEMGYLPNSHARTLTTKKSWTIGVVFIESLGVGMKHPFFNAVIESFKQNVEYLGYDLLFASRQISNQQKSYLDHFRYRGVDGIVIVCSTFSDEQVEEIMKAAIPSVVIDLHSPQASVVYSDNLAGSRMVVEYLHSLGHERIAHIAGHEYTFAGEQRKKGYVDTMDALSKQIPEGYIVDGGYFSREEGYNAMMELLRLTETPTAVYAAGDNLAIGAMEALRDAGLKVPEDISIIGFDDIELAQFVYPPLTTIRQKTNLIGKEAAALLIKQIDNKEKINESIKVPVELIERSSCKVIK